MKRITGLLSALLAVTVFSGCAKKGIHTAPLETNFRTADPGVKSDVDNAISDIKAGKYSEALAYLNKVAGKAKLTAEQQQAVKDVIGQITAQMQQAANKAAAGAQKTATGLQQSLGK